MNVEGELIPSTAHVHIMSLFEYFIAEKGIGFTSTESWTYIVSSCF